MLRSARAETRNKAKDELKRVINSATPVRKWERRWIVVKDTTMKVLKWVPVAGTADHASTNKFKNGIESAEESLDAFDKNGAEQSLRSSEAFATRIVRPPTDFSALTVEAAKTVDDERQNVVFDASESELLDVPDGTLAELDSKRRRL